MPFVSASQRRFMWANHPEVAREFQDATPKGAKLPEHVKKSFARGTADAFAHFGFKQAAEEIRLKMTPNRQFHGIDGAFKTLAEKNQKKANSQEPLEPQASPDQPVEILTQLLQSLDTPTDPATDATRDRLDREPAWGSPSHLGASDARGSSLGQNTGIGGV